MQLPTVSGNLKKMLYSCLWTSFVSCYCVFTEKIRRKQQRCDHQSLFLSPSQITSRLLRRLECVAWRIVASHCDHKPADQHVARETRTTYNVHKPVTSIRHSGTLFHSTLYQVEASPIFSGHVRVNQWSKFFGRGPIFSGHRSWNVWWWFFKLRWDHDTCFSLFLISLSL